MRRVYKATEWAIVSRPIFTHASFIQLISGGTTRSDTLLECVDYASDAGYMVGLVSAYSTRL